MRTVLTLLACLLFLPLSAMKCYIMAGDTLPADSLKMPHDTLMLAKIEVMEDELVEISETLDQMAGQEEQQNALESKKKIVHFGLSLGYRWLTKRSSAQNVVASVSPIDSTLRLTALDRTSYLFSTSVVFDLNLGKMRNPAWEENFHQRRISKQDQINLRRSKRDLEPRLIRTHRSACGRFLARSVDRLCIVSNLNILDFSNGQKELAFNKSIEGGLGIGYRLNDAMYIGLNWEHVQTLQLFDDIKRYEGKKIELGGTQLVSSAQLDPDNEDLYYRKNLSGWGIKMIICL